MDTNTSLARRGIMNGVLTAIYIILMALFLWHVPQPLQNLGWIGPAVGLMVFVVSALITGSLVLWSPLKLLADGKKQEAGMLLFVTGATLVVLLTLMLVIGLVTR